MARSCSILTAATLRFSTRAISAPVRPAIRWNRACTELGMDALLLRGDPQPRSLARVLRPRPAAQWTALDPGDCIGLRTDAAGVRVEELRSRRRHSNIHDLEERRLSHHGEGRPGFVVTLVDNELV